MAAILVTGGSGFLGRHLLAALGEASDLVVAGRRRPLGGPDLAFLSADLERPEDVRDVLDQVRPQWIFHLAGKTPPGEPAALYRANTLITYNLLEGLRILQQPVRVVMTGSAAELGPVPVSALPVGEDFAGRARDPYGLSKWFATDAGLRAEPPIEVIVARLFNPIGPGSPGSQAFGRFAARLASPGSDPLRLAVGDLETRRDFVDVRDAVRALILLACDGRGGTVYHVGTGRSRSVAEGLDYLARLSGRPLEIDSLTDRIPVGPRDSRADNTRLVHDTGWRAEIPFEESLDDLWAEARRMAAHIVPPPPHLMTRAAVPVRSRVEH